jgi:hypothetical protein
MERRWQDEAAALWLAPLAATLPLVAACSIPSSPFYLGKLIDDPAHPMNWPRLGPLISALAVVFDGQILGFLTLLFLVAPAWVGLRHNGRNSLRNGLILGAAAGIVASQIARLIAQGFRQADLRAFANSWQSPLIGCLCGLAAGAFIAYFAKRRIGGTLLYCLPVVAQIASAVVLILSAKK